MSQRAYERSTAIDFLSSWRRTANQTCQTWTSVQWPPPRAREIPRTRTLFSACTSRKRALTTRYPRWPHAIHIHAIRQRYPHAHPIHRCKYLIPHDMTMGQLVYVLRKRIAVPAEQAIFVFVGNTLPPASALVSNVVRAARVGMLWREVASATLPLSALTLLLSCRIAVPEAQG